MRMAIPMTYRRRLGVAALLVATVAPLAACGSETARPGADSPRSSGPGASPYVEPGVVDGAPHHGDNNAYRRPRDMTAAGQEAARAEAARMEPVLKRLWRQKKWDPQSVRAALTGRLGYEGAMIGLYVGDDACVTAFVQESDYGVTTNGRFMETGCIAPPIGH
ncbi:hypothetical protein [Streptomyces sp. NPDC003032]